MNISRPVRIHSRVTPLSRLRGGVYVPRERQGRQARDQAAALDDPAADTSCRGSGRVGAASR